MALSPPYVSVADGRTITESVVRALAVVVGAFLFAGVFSSLGAALLGVDVQNGLDASSTPPALYAAINAISFVGFILAAVAYLQVRDDSSLVYLRRPRPSDLGWALVGVVGILLGSLVMGVVVQALSALAAALFGVTVESGQNSIITQGRENPVLFLYMVPVALLFVGPAEELVFRGVAQGLLRRAFGVVPGLVFASLLFGFGHYLAISSGSAWTYILTASALGLVLGAVYEYTENIAVPALAHGLWNAGLFVLNYYIATTSVTMPG
ncbi:CPBP family intramembrane glutamic endopeptidase [Haloarcula onubensis]|uniref:CPBP family intramembrane metalloprotease n=1 Tax=Haloarcula onubensis TaxID=2950539 RepID=A0ABU2FNA0_9EURY|nr:CPBP family intramembrane glutamic endopeptidase [Halomicroarcula sp. S3CR25-11]MDS0282235.1 CPBP family intramembrane metalloprotease [Halomicroarcula sp. S3CR25-11]